MAYKSMHARRSQTSTSSIQCSHHALKLTDRPSSLLQPSLRNRTSLGRPEHPRTWGDLCCHEQAGYQGCFLKNSLSNAVADVVEREEHRRVYAMSTETKSGHAVRSKDTQQGGRDEELSASCSSGRTVTSRAEAGLLL